MGLHIKGNDAPILARPSAHFLTGTRAIARHQELCLAVQHQVHGPLQLARGAAGEGSFQTNSKLSTKTATHVLTDHTHLTALEPEVTGKGAGVAAHRLGGGIDRGFVSAVVVHHAAVGFQAQVMLHGNAVGCRNPHIRSGQGLVRLVNVTLLARLAQIAPAIDLGGIRLGDLLLADQHVVSGGPFDLHRAHPILGRFR